MKEANLTIVLRDLADQGWSVMPNFFEPEMVAELRAECEARHAAGAFHKAGVGSGRAEVISEIRGDAILWIEPDDPNPSVRRYLGAMEVLRENVNREFYMGLAELESHFAMYPVGAYYKKHLDRFRDDDRRALTTIVYLNRDWTEADGGQLRFWTDPDGEGEYFDVPPAGGTLVTFLSELYWHEVLPSNRLRQALTGWFKRR